MDVKDIIEAWLKENGYDGLYGEECACRIDDLMPCEEPGTDCEAGYEGPCDGTCEYAPCDFHIYKNKEDIPKVEED